MATENEDPVWQLGRWLYTRNQGRNPNWGSAGRGTKDIYMRVAYRVLDELPTLIEEAKRDRESEWANRE